MTNMRKTQGKYFDREIAKLKENNKRKKVRVRLGIVLYTAIIAVMSTLILKGIDWIFLGGPANTKNIIYNTTFGSGDVLSFSGVILGGAFLLLGVVLTIRSEHDLSVEERVFSVKPYLISYKSDDNSSENDKQKSDYNITNAFLRVADGEIVFSEEMQNPFERTNNRTRDVINFQAASRRYVCFRYVLENIGCGSIVHANVYLNGCRIDNDVFFGIAVGGRREYTFLIDLGIYVNDPVPEPGLQMTLQIGFSDSINVTRYRQKETFTIKRGDPSNQFLEICDWSGLGAPEVVSENDT